MPSLRKLNQKGIGALQQFLSEIVLDPDKSVPVALLDNADTSDSVSVSIVVEPKSLASRMEAAEYLAGLFAQSEKIALDPGVWAWLSLFYFDQLCPKRKDGTRKPGEIARWIPSGHAWRYYRHLLAGPYLIYRAFRDDPKRAAVVLCGPLDTPGDFVEQLASRQDFVQNRAVIEAATKLYLNLKTGKPRRGTADTKHRPGTLRRFIDIINQLDPTWDLYAMTADQLLAKLPQEFNPYKVSVGTEATP